MKARYKLTELPPSADALLNEIGKKRGALRSGGVIDRHKAAERLDPRFSGGSAGTHQLGNAG